MRKLSAIEWSTERLDGCIHFLSYYNRAVFEHLCKYFPELTITVSRHQKNLTTWHYNETELEAVYCRALDFFTRRPGWFISLRKKWRSGVRRFLKYYRVWRNKDLKLLSSPALIKAQAQFYDLAKRTIYIPFFIEGLTVGRRKLIDERLQQWTEEHDCSKDYSLIYQTLTTPDKPSFVTRAHLDLLNMTPRSYQAKYSWLRNNYYAAVTLTLKEIKAEAAAVRKKRAIFDSAKIKKTKAHVLRQFSLPPDLRAQLAWLAQLTHWQDERKQMVLMVIEIANRFLEQASRRAGISLSDLKNSLASEYGDIMRGKLRRAALDRRSNSLVFWRTKSVKVLAGVEAKRVNQTMFKATPISGVKIIKGIGASAGRAAGPAKIMLSSSQGDKLKPGDVLVAGMTRPDYVQAMRRAGAVVTDEGGITAHAAIIARELGIPCVVGTKIATQVLRDGDRVEVDAERGVVRKL